MDNADEKLTVAAQKLRVALALNESGFEMKRQQSRRRFPDADEAEIDERLRSWLQDRPLDGPPGRVLSWPEWKASRSLE